MIESKLNGAPSPREMALADLKDWAIAYVTHEAGFVGRVVDVTGENEHMPDVVQLSPAYTLIGGHQLNISTMTGQMHGMGRVFALAPFEFLSAALTLPVRPVVFLPLAALNESDFAFMGGQILQCVRQAEEIRTNTRVQRAGLAIAGPGARVPPMPGRAG